MTSAATCGILWRFGFVLLVLMSETVIKVENISKFYQLGLINHGTLAKDLQGWWAKIRGKEDPNSRISMVSNKSTNSDADFIYALKDVSFDVKQGEVLGIIGANGAGKSTLLKILSRVTSPTSGCIKIKGRIGSLLEVGTGFHPELTGHENIYLNGAILGMRKWEIDKKLDEIIDFSGVEKFIDTPVKRYSSGMYVRLAFAVAAHLDPEILVVDEVLAVGDADFQKKCLGKMGDVSKKEGRTVLFVSHNMAAIRQLCTRGILLRNGGLVFDGGTEETINEYLSVNRNPNFSNHIVRKNNINSKISIKELFIYKNDILSDGFYNAGDKLLVKIKMQYKTEPNDFDYGVLIHIFKNDGTRIATSSSMLMYGKTYKTESEVSFVLDTYTLVPGKYYVEIAAHNHFKHEVFDEFKNAFCFSVEKNDVNAVGYNYGTQWNPLILIPVEWA